MRVLTILSYYHPHWTGLTVHAVRLAEELVARGHTVTVLTTRHDPALAPKETRNGVRIVRLKPVGRFSRGMITPDFPAAAAHLIARHDVVQIHTPLPEALLVATLCRALGRPLVMTHHGDVVMPAGAFNQFVQRAAFLLLRATGMLASAITAYSKDYADHSRLLHVFGPKLAYIYPPVEVREPDPAGAAAWRESLGLSDRLLIGFGGRWVEEKGFDYLLEALPLIRETYPQAHLAYAGEQNVIYDNFYARCKPLIAAQREHITFLGLIRDPQQLANFYAMCDLVAVPSRTDNMPLFSIEALLCGTPLVVSDIPGARVVVHETGFGRLAPPNNPRSLAQTIVEALADRDRLRPNRAAVRATFNTEHTITQYENVMERALRRLPVGALPGPASRAAEPDPAIRGDG